MAITLEPTRMEIPQTKRGKPSYQWVDAYYIVSHGSKQYPPLRVREAMKTFREMTGRGATSADLSKPK